MCIYSITNKFWMDFFVHNHVLFTPERTNLTEILKYYRVPNEP